MSFEALSAVGACVQIVKTLYEYHAVHSRNKALLDILEGFSQNLEISLERLQAREEILGLGKNDALESIERDFTAAKSWLITNDKRLRSIWTALQASDKLADLDARLTKAFASKMAVAIFSALQDTRAGVVKLQTTLEGLPTNLETVCRTSTKEAIHEAITELKKEAYEAVGGSERGPRRGFKNGEAEKIISALVDQLAAQERIKEEEEELASPVDGPPPVQPARSTSVPPVPYGPTASSSSTSRRVSSYAPSVATTAADDPFAPATSRASSLFSRRRSTTTLATSVAHSDGETLAPPSMSADDASMRTSKNKAKSKKDRLPPGAIVFHPRDPFTDTELVDPVLANDGLIHDRWSLVAGTGTHKNLRDPGEPLVIVGDVVQLREALFKSFPERRAEWQERRQAYRRDTLDLYESSNYAQLPDLVDRLSHVLLFEPTSVSLRVRRGLCFYRLRLLDKALEDLDVAVDLSRRGVDGERDVHEPDVDALRARALVLEEMHDNTAALRDVDLVLASTPHDVLALSLRASLHGVSGDAKAAQADLAATNAAVRNGKAYRSRLGDADCDLEYLARGWAYCHVGDFSSAFADFGFSAGLKDPPEPYTLACRALAKIKDEETSGSLSSETLSTCLAELDDAIDLLRKVGIKEDKLDECFGRRTSGAPVLRLGEDGLPVSAYPLLFLRASARTAQGDLGLALHDFETAFRLRGGGVRDVATVRAALAELRAACGDLDGAQRDFDRALAVCEPGQRFAIVQARDELSA
ncbi:uncharacterized protein RHOBADRAFT_51862 [Rhodotorula graminis WP1]|uniref:Uncharacterized protein n=1 Tax=Rhodotorula graminis (strain WP1) TaxID=578459 RepID=A0A194S8E9_RHOGW|nr:uncharacterized protein RHOBADRAFT_51862 [Rhodotorula graminis WP1]KPV76877.1 hypothetical protein RHOBADRAFT_51862 [Rhodotorula graminis WP1]